MKDRSDVEKFHDHLGRCRKCERDDLIQLCHIGIELLLECADKLDERWQGVARDLHLQDRLEREAEANFRYYADSTVPADGKGE
jgi:hypothetical protein